MLSQEIAEDSKIGLCSDEAALTYAFTLPFLDRDGLCSGKPSWIAGRALQERPHLQHKAGAYIQEWVTQGLVIRYQGSDGPVLFFPGFRKHNANMPYEKEQRSKFPPPPGYHRDEDKNGVCHGLIPDDPEVAGRLADAFDARSLYHKALTEAASHNETLAQSLGMEDTPDSPLHNEVATSSRPSHDWVGMNRIEVEVKEKGREEEKRESTNNGAEAPPARPSSSKDHPCIKAYHELHNRYPNRTQMATIIEHDLPLEDWRRAIHAWDMAGHNPTNVQGMLEWTLDPARIDGGPRGSAPKGGQRKTGYNDYDDNAPPPDEDRLKWRAEMTRSKLAKGEATP